MLCAISGEAPQQPVASKKSGNVFERRLIEAYISENGTDPVNGEELSIDDLIDLKQARLVKARPPTLTSIPALLSTFQNEWDAIVLESYTLKQQLAETRQELSTALYYNDAAQRVIARLQAERDEARDALSRISVTGNGNAATNGDSMQVDGQSLSEAVIQNIDETQARLSATRRKRPVPADWATADQVSRYEMQSTSDGNFVQSRSLSGNPAGDLFACGNPDGTIGIYDSSKGAFSEEANIGQGAILASTWINDQPAFSTSTGTVIVLQPGGVRGEVHAQFHQHAGPANSIASHPSGDYLVTVGSDKSYVLYDVPAAKALTQVYTGSDLKVVAVHPDGQILAAGTSSGSILLYDIKTSQLMHTFESSEATTPIAALAFSENGTWLASAAQGQSTATVWHLGKANVFATLDFETPVSSLAWDYTGQFLAACGSGGVVVKQYNKSSKSWTEPLRKGVAAVAIQWGAQAHNLVLSTANGIAVLGS